MQLPVAAKPNKPKPPVGTNEWGLRSPFCIAVCTSSCPSNPALHQRGQTQHILVQLAGPEAATESNAAAHRPTKRQLDYLLFIHKYIAHYGKAPAEADIERHFLVSAPSVNQMMQTLERRGFITRQPGLPRSARLCIELDGWV